MTAPRFSFTVAPGEGLATARRHYEAGAEFLVRLKEAATSESRTRCATSAAAHFSAGQLALAIDNENQRLRREQEPTP